MRRREFIMGIGAAVAPSFIWPLVARAQQPERVRHIGVLMNVIQEDPSGSAEVLAFRQGLTELGLAPEFGCVGWSHRGLLEHVWLGRSFMR